MLKGVLSWMQAPVKGIAPLPGKHSWHAGSSIAGVPLTAEDLVALLILPGLDCACHVDFYFLLSDSDRLAHAVHIDGEPC